MKTKRYPSVTFVIATYNSSRTIEKCLKSVYQQQYSGRVEIIIADGGSIDRTLKIAQSYGATVIPVSQKKQNAEYNKGIGVNRVKTDLIAMVDHDNELPHPQWLKNMVDPLLAERESIGSAVNRFGYDRTMSLLDRYFALIGTLDPVTLFFNKSAHQSYLYSSFNLRGTVLKKTKQYTYISFSPDYIPALGGNGCLLWRKYLRYAKHDPKHFFHIDIHVDIIKHGFNKYCFVNETIRHYSNNTFFSFLKRRMYYVDKYYYKDLSRRRYSIYEPGKDQKRLVLFVLYAVSFVVPLYQSVRGFSKIPDVAWFIHPFMCWAILVAYGVPAVKYKLYGLFQK